MMKDKYYFVYLLTSKKHGTLYVGVTSNLAKRIYEHKNDVVESFTKQYQVHKLVYYEIYEDATDALKREKQLKLWKRDWKIKLVESKNPDWEDLFEDVASEW